MSPPAKRTVRVTNDLGLHLRAAGALVQTATRFAAEVWLERPGTRANGKSIMSVLSLAAAKGTILEVSAEGPDADAAVQAVADLIENGFVQG